jgi:hypothetical protein
VGPRRHQDVAQKRIISTSARNDTLVFRPVPYPAKRQVKLILTSQNRLLKFSMQVYRMYCNK